MRSQQNVQAKRIGLGGENKALFAVSAPKSMWLTSFKVTQIVSLVGADLVPLDSAIVTVP
ncbi:hypothetical protein C7B82_15925 [Stenomitos frigidus ULC18]|uniref:Uncharacterized protein n=1 Tax=Stenomitos frigidus ULC18 TaxID=2107698 RepID=A0A2T1E5D5_9CYAN|nr:hypothetical protein C7B82_15925 [Stenomitos frigidus ULC18]